MKASLALEEAEPLAQSILRRLQPGCQRIEIAGSIRRRKPIIGDIEIVAIPLYNEKPDLAGGMIRTSKLDPILKKAVLELNWRPITKGEKYKSFDIGTCSLDIFITTPEKWGVIFTLRTGSADFSHRLVKPRKYGGLMPAFMRCDEGRLYVHDHPLSTPEEADVFEALGIEYIPPEERTR